jgi:hypothetical protein
MQLIETVTVGSGGAASITFSSIPATFTDLYLVMSLRNTVATSTGTLALNTGGIYTRRRLLGDGSSASSDTPSSDYLCSSSTDTASTFGTTGIYIPNYTSSVAKSYSVDTVSENNATTAYQILIAGLWSGTDAVTTITLTPQGASADWAQYSSASLFGVLAGTDGIVTVS